ncbi:alpha/beta fold hydrolase [Nocardioides sp. CN2-186]|uniref:alpha/beta fold hydrolase n=1 Tax=Nocardioides tweenelious TaxID=3156607 RepID=UPI0032B352D9
MTTQHTVSADGTEIAYEVHGRGPALVIVDGALCSRTMGPARGLSDALSGDFTVYIYDRRGRGESGPGATAYAVDREVEDLGAVIAVAGGHAHVFAASSGAALALEGARAGIALDSLVAYEAPFILDDTHAPNPVDLPEQLQAMVDDGRRGDAVKTFLRTVGAPAVMVAVMPLMPPWRKLKAVAHTLPYDLSIVVPFEQGTPLPGGYYDQVAAPTLVIAGGKSPHYMRNAQAAIAAAVPGAELAVLPGQTHMIKPKVVAPVVTAHLHAHEGAH